jgi:hypothetical protein
MVVTSPASRAGDGRVLEGDLIQTNLRLLRSDTFAVFANYGDRSRPTRVALPIVSAVDAQADASSPRHRHGGHSSVPGGGLTNTFSESGTATASATSS